METQNILGYFVLCMIYSSLTIVLVSFNLFTIYKQFRFEQDQMDNYNQNRINNKKSKPNTKSSSKRIVLYLSYLSNLFFISTACITLIHIAIHMIQHPSKIKEIPVLQSSIYSSNGVSLVQGIANVCYALGKLCMYILLYYRIVFALKNSIYEYSQQMYTFMKIIIVFLLIFQIITNVDTFLPFFTISLWIKIGLSMIWLLLDTFYSFLVVGLLCYKLYQIAKLASATHHTKITHFAKLAMVKTDHELKNSVKNDNDHDTNNNLQLTSVSHVNVSGTQEESKSQSQSHVQSRSQSPSQNIGHEDNKITKIATENKKTIDLMRLVVKLCVLASIAVISSFSLIFAVILVRYYSMAINVWISLDAVINGVCIQLCFGFLNKQYVCLCSNCHNCCIKTVLCCHK